MRAFQTLFAAFTLLGASALFAQSAPQAQEEAPERAAPAQAEEAAPRVDAYTVTACPISGKALGSMGEPIVLELDGRAVQLCCRGCVGPANADPAGTAAKVDAAFADQQRPHYPLTTCLISGEPLAQDGVDVAVEVVVGNRLFRLCCDTCAAKVRRDPAAMHGKLDEAVIAAQSPDYPLQNCLVSDKNALGSMGEPVEFVVGDRLVRLCCGSCRPAFDAEPAKYLARLEAAWAAAAEEAGPERDAASAGAGAGR
ncbi:hypothetical protein [Engelhardtia mirabilis]|uniref:Archaeal TRASH domain protein n=1 Tax=Engelhardtia mirabilis TaxID=2528011 RepID=A0A518BQA5_9BACT|nr:Archaeal TRASH domain protein [Planctomycetes bacterium Pla133]QDV03482.1 Archaeal TRASH domain protein [Planctomycetes bacterium Pla86]